MSRLTVTRRLTLAFALLLLGFGALVALLGRSLAHEHEQESTQRLSHGLARHIVEHWPELTAATSSDAERAARDALLAKLMVVNPGIQVYLLDAQGRVDAYLGEPGMVRQPQVDLAPLRRFLADAPLPLRGTDPMGAADGRIFSVAPLPPRSGDSRAPGYLYIALDGGARDAVAGAVSLRRVWQGAALALAAATLLTLLLGSVAFARLTLPLRRLAQRMQQYRAGDGQPQPQRQVDEVQAIAGALDDMTRRIDQQAEHERSQSAAHREVMAGVAHDLRTPLTALHGHLEALTVDRGDTGRRHLDAALAQSNKVRRLSQQLFELAALQSADEVLHRERFQLEDLVTDTVQKFGLSRSSSAVQLEGPAPGRLELDGDLQLVERALTNLIDNAVRHAPDGGPVQVRVERAGLQARVLVQDGGPGLPRDVWQRLDQGQSLRFPPLARPGGGIGGLGLAIAQRVAVLHGGSLTPLPAPGGGTRLCLQLPLAA